MSPYDLDISMPNMTEQLNALRNFTYVPSNPSEIYNAGWFYPVYALYSGMGDVVWLLVVAFTMGIVYIRTQSLPAMAFVALLFAGITAAFMPTIGAKIMYVVVIFTIAGTMWIMFGRR